MMSTAYVSEMMTRLLGAGFVTGGTISMTFIKPVYAGDRLTVRGVVTEVRSENGARRVVVEVWCENQHGEKTAVGTASGRGVLVVLRRRPSSGEDWFVVGGGSRPAGQRAMHEVQARIGPPCASR